MQPKTSVEQYYVVELFFEKIVPINYAAQKITFWSPAWIVWSKLLRFLLPSLTFMSLKFADLQLAKSRYI